MKRAKIYRMISFVAVLMLVGVGLCSNTATSRLDASALPTEPQSSPAPQQAANGLIYADFETLQDNRPVSSRGGYVHLSAYQETAGNPCTYKGKEGTDAPEIVRPSRDSPNKAAAFDYQLRGPNQWGGVTLEISGQPDKDGKPVPDDVSGYKYLTFQVYATGVTGLKVQFTSKTPGVPHTNGPPEMNFKVTKGFNKYRIPLKSVAQPGWADPKVSTKDVLKNLTSVSLVVSCSPCVQANGTVVVDNVVFEN
jgi:hypothetical protein